MSVRHSALVRVTHWVTAAAFVALLVSGMAILLAHPRLYWGETGAIGGPSLVDLPLPFVLAGQSGWGRSLHFLSAWIAVVTGLVYVVDGLASRHFRDHLLPRRPDLTWRALSAVIQDHFRHPRPEEAATYNALQRMTYLGVVFVVMPLMIWTGLAMSPAITSVFPLMVEAFKGQQSARTIHFVGAGALVVFVVVHVGMVWRGGFVRRVRAMMTGRPAAGAAASP